MTATLQAKRAALDAHYAELTKRIDDETANAYNQINFGTPAGDEYTLRGIPAIGHNVAGAIPGTNPGRSHPFR